MVRDGAGFCPTTSINSSWYSENLPVDKLPAECRLGNLQVLSQNAENKHAKPTTKIFHNPWHIHGIGIFTYTFTSKIHQM